MHLQDLDVVVGVERLGDLAGEGGEQIDAEAHVAGGDDGGVAGGGRNLGLVLGLEAGGAVYVHDAGVGGEAGEFHRGLGDREIEHRIDLGEQLERVVRDEDAELAETRQQADVLTQRDRAFLLDGAGDDTVLPRVDGPHQLAPHPPGRPGDGDLHLAHGADPCRFVRV